METGISVAAIISALAAAGLGVVVVCVALVAGFIALAVFWWRETSKLPHLARLAHNPILEPKAEHWWENEAVFNPAAVVANGRVHLFYRAMGRDGISRIGYASSPDGVHFDERLPYPVFEPGRTPDPRRAPGPLSYDTTCYASGGGWGGAEDPRATKIDGRVHLSFTLFENWGSGRISLTSLPEEKLGAKEWLWKKLAFLSPPGQLHKNWVIFPECIGGRYAILHSISPKIAIEYVDSLDEFDEEERYIHGSGRGNAGRKEYWDVFVRGAGPPPIKTPDGWLLLYHGMDPKEHHIGHRVGAMLLDLDNPERVLYRSSKPVLEAKEWYENDWKPGVTYASGAVVLGDDLIVYYGGGDKHVAAARANLREFIRRLKSDDCAVLEPVEVTL